MAGELQPHGRMAAARKNDDNDSDGAIHKMDTLPPPEGEDDAYNAATKVGPMARAAVEAMMAKAQVDENSSLPPPASFTRGVKLPKPGRLPAMMDATPREPELEKIYDEVEDGDLFEPTALLAVAEAPAASVAPSFPSVSATPPAMLSIAPESTPDALPTPPIAPARPSTLAAEIAIFAGTFVALSLVALVVYLMWLR